MKCRQKKLQLSVLNSAVSYTLRIFILGMTQQSKIQPDEPLDLTRSDIDEMIEDLKRDIEAEEITPKSVIRFCYHKLLYAGPFSIARRLHTQDWTADDCMALQRRTEICRQILSFPMPTEYRRMPRGWKLRPQSTPQEKANAELESVWKKMIHDPPYDRAIDDAVMSQIVRSTLKEMLAEVGIDPEVWFVEFERRVQEVISV